MKIGNIVERTKRDRIIQILGFNKQRLLGEMKINLRLALAVARYFSVREYRITFYSFSWSYRFNKRSQTS